MSDQPRHVYALEIGCEEIPARFIEGLLSGLQQKLQELLAKARIDHQTVETFGTYRRLAIRITGLAPYSTKELQDIRGPLAKISRDETGEWLAPALGFLRRYGLGPADAGQLRIQAVEGTDYVFLTHVHEARPTVALLPELVSTTVKQLALPVEMYWGDKQGPFVRPVHWMMSLLDDHVLPFEIFGIQSDRYTYGHRFLTQNGSNTNFASGQCIPIHHANDYVDTLRDHHVIVDISERRARIASGLPLSARQGKEGLLEEVTALTEWPTVITGKIDAKYRHLPGEAVATCIEKNQRYFSLCGNIPVSENSELDRDCVWIVADNVRAHNAEIILAGNMKVLNARLEDVLFFWEEDLKSPLENKLEALKTVMYQQNLGSLYDKSQRVKTGVQQLAEILEWHPAPREAAVRAAILSKADQVTHMVMEMTELQGVMGSIYAQKSGESDTVSQALLDLYQAKPTTTVGALLGIADRADSLVACFRNGLIPTGSKDPWGLRREALRLIHAMVFAPDMSPAFEALSVRQVLGIADTVLENAFGPSASEGYLDMCMNLCRDRFAYFLSESAHTLNNDIIAAVVGDTTLYPVRQLQWAQRLQQLRNGTPADFKALVETAIRVKRMAGTSDAMCDPRLLQEPAELALFDALYPRRELLTTATSAPAPDTRIWISKWVPAFQMFFEHVLVMVPNTQIRDNRLGLLAWANRQFAVMGDLEKIVISGS